MHRMKKYCKYYAHIAHEFIVILLNIKLVRLMSTEKSNA